MSRTNRPRKYQKSLKQILKENGRNNTPAHLFYKTSSLPISSNLFTLLYDIKNESDLEKKNKLIAKLLAKTGRSEKC